MNKKNIMMFALLALTAVSAFAQDAAIRRTAIRSRRACAGASSARHSFSASPRPPAPSVSPAPSPRRVEGIARNPGAAGAIRLAMIIGLALIESLVIYALLIAFIIQGR